MCRQLATGMRHMRWRRSAWWFSGVLLAAVIAVDTAVWFVVTGRIEQGIAVFVARAAVDGWRIEGEAPARDGWPWVATIRVPHVVATRALGSAEVRWTIDALDLTVSPTNPAVLQLAALGQQTVGFGVAAPLPFQANRAVLQMPFSGAPATLMVRGFSAGTERAGVRAGFITAEISGLALGITADTVELTPALPRPFDGALAVSAQLVTNAAFPEAATPGASAAAWQAAGGRAEVPALELRWGPLLANGSGSGRLDAAMQPEGRATLHVSGAVEVLDAMARGGLVPSAPASAARAVLGLLAMAARGGPLTLPVALADRTLTVAQFPLVRLPVLDWNLP